MNYKFVKVHQGSLEVRILTFTLGRTFDIIHQTLEGYVTNIRRSDVCNCSGSSFVSRGTTEHSTVCQESIGHACRRMSNSTLNVSYKGRTMD
jgi:hypothetical protein